MHKKILLSFFLLNTTIFLMSSKPPLPKEAFHPERVPYELLDYTLKVRPFTQIDSLHELLEDHSLNTSQEEALEKLKREQESIVQQTKTIYLTKIEELKKQKFNRSLFIQKTIEEYREILKEIISEILRNEIDDFCQSLRRRQRE